MSFGLVGQLRIHEFFVFFITILISIYFRLIKEAKIMLQIDSFLSSFWRKFLMESLIQKCFFLFLEILTSKQMLQALLILYFVKDFKEKEIAFLKERVYQKKFFKKVITNGLLSFNFLKSKLCACPNTHRRTCIQWLQSILAQCHLSPLSIEQ